LAEKRATKKQPSGELNENCKPVDCGPLSAARFLEPMAMLWIHLCVNVGWGPDFAFKIVKR
jgi:8-hydroxy-5-deazaflavin:NADPH oxidoreductase